MALSRPTSSKIDLVLGNCVHEDERILQQDRRFNAHRFGKPNFTFNSGIGFTYILEMYFIYYFYMTTMYIIFYSYFRFIIGRPLGQNSIR